MFPSSRFEVLLHEQGISLIPSSKLMTAFSRGHIPVYVLDKIKMTNQERAYTRHLNSDTIWVTQQISRKPIKHRMIESNGKIVFEIGSGDFPSINSRMKEEISTCLHELINVCTATKVKPIEIMTMSECLMCLRLMNDLSDKYTYSKLVLFDEGTIGIRPKNKEMNDLLYRYILSKTNRVQPKMIRATKDICHRFLCSLKQRGRNQ